MYKIKMKVFEYGNLPYEDEPAFNPPSSKEDAFQEAKRLADEECAFLKSVDPNGEYHVVVSNDIIRLCYGKGQAYEDTMIYWVEEIAEDCLLYGITQMSVETGKEKEPQILISNSVYPTREEAEEAAWQAYSHEYRFAQEYGLFSSPSHKLSQSVFCKKLWANPVTQDRVDIQFRINGWTQPLKLER